MIATDDTAAPRFAVLAPRAAEAPAARSGEAVPPGDNPAAMKPFGDDGFSFYDFLDVINPLQHLPVISTIYRHLTGDTIDTVPRIAGGALFGGPIGAAAAMANVAVQHETGRDMGQHVVAMFDTDDAPGSMVADRAASPATAAPTPAAAANPPPAADEGFVWTGDDDAAALAVDPALPLAARPSPQAAEGAPPIPLFAVNGGRGPLFGGGAAIPEGSPAASAPAGSTAQNGGWFADAMLTGLQKYERAAAADNPAPQAVNAVY